VTSFLDLPTSLKMISQPTSSSGELSSSSESKHEDSFSDEAEELQSLAPLLYTEKDEDLEFQFKGADVTPPKSRRQQYLDAIWMLVNVISTVVIVFLNKMQVLSRPRTPTCCL